MISMELMDFSMSLMDACNALFADLEASLDRSMPEVMDTHNRVRMNKIEMTVNILIVSLVENDLCTPIDAAVVCF